MIVGYCRVSSREQAVNSEALDQQKARIRPHCEELIVDVESGSSRKRPGMARVESMIRQGECEKLVCTRLDRLTRSLGHLQRLIEVAMANDCKIVCLDDNFDLSSATGRFHANIIGSVAEMEAAMLSERVRHGTAYRRKQGKANGAPFGYVMNTDGYLEFDTEPCVCLLETKKEFSRYQLARLIIERRLDPPKDAKGRKMRSLAHTISGFHEMFGIQRPGNHPGRILYRALGFSRAGIHTWLKNPALQGHTVYNRRIGSRQTKPADWVWKRDTHPALITEDEAAQLKLVEKANFFQAHDAKHRRLPTNGLVRCQRCRSICHLASCRTTLPHRWNYYYRCPKWSARTCDNKKMTRAEKVESAIIDTLVAQANKICNWYQKGDPIKQQSLPPKVLELKASLEALEALPFNPAIESSKAAIRAEIEESMAIGKMEQVALVEKEKALAGLTSRGFWEGADSETKLRLYQQFVSAVYVDSGEIADVQLSLRS